MSNVNLTLLEHQAKFATSDEKVIGLVAGYGSGKSIAGTVRTILKLIKEKSDVAYYLPSYPLIRDIAFKNFDEYLGIFGIRAIKNTTNKEYITPYGRIILRSMDRPDYIVGYEVGHSVIDEADIIHKDKMDDLFKKIKARNRAKTKSGNNTIGIISTPEGYNFMYDYFEKQKKGLLLRASTFDNPFLPADYIQGLLDDYSAREIEAYLHGKFVNLKTGNVFDFDRNKHHSDRELKQGDVLHIGIDFNIGNMSAIIHVIEKGKMIAINEISGAYDTYELAEKIKYHFKGHRVAVYPDASGGARKTSATLTDIEILKRAGFIVRAEKKNPYVTERIKYFNMQLRKGLYFVNTNNCIRYTEALEQLGYDKSGIPDKQSGFDHLTDAGTYFVWKQKKTTISIR